MSARLDFEFEHVLGSWLDHCAESLSLHLAAPLDGAPDAARSAGAADAVSLLAAHDGTGMLMVAAAAASSHAPAESPGALDAGWLAAARGTAERLRGIVADSAEKARETLRVLLVRLRRLRPLPPRFVAASAGTSDGSGGSDAPLAGLPATTAILVTPDLARQARAAVIAWMLFDVFLQALPLIVVPWCIATRDFAALVERSLPWEYALGWCDALVASWAPLFAAVDRAAGQRVANIGRQRSASVALDQSSAADTAARRRADDAAAMTRDASAAELAELERLAQRLVAALHRHRPSDGRSAVVKLEGAAALKREAALQLGAAAALMRGVGNTADTAVDVDADYEPTYIAGATMGALVKSEPVAAPAPGAATDAAGGGARREARKRPR
jgi:hypothetical protein